MEQLSVVQNANLQNEAMPGAWIAACNLLDGSGSESELEDALKKLVANEAVNAWL